MDEVASTAWRKSTFSQGGDCVEWQFTKHGVQVRHSHDTEGLVLTFTRAEWRAFVAGVKASEADR